MSMKRLSVVTTIENTVLVLIWTTSHNWTVQHHCASYSAKCSDWGIPTTASLRLLTKRIRSASITGNVQEVFILVVLTGYGYAVGICPATVHVEDMGQSGTVEVLELTTTCIMINTF